MLTITLSSSKHHVTFMVASDTTSFDLIRRFTLFSVSTGSVKSIKFRIDRRKTTKKKDL